MAKPTARHATPYSLIHDLATTIKKAAGRLESVDEIAAGLINDEGWDE